MKVDSYKFVFFKTNTGFWMMKFSNEIDETGRNINYTRFSLKFSSKENAELFVDKFKKEYEKEFESFLKDAKVNVETMSTIYDSIDNKWNDQLIIEKGKHGDGFYMFNSPESFNNLMVKRLKEEFECNNFYIDTEPKPLTYTQKDIDDSNLPADALIDAINKLKSYKQKLNLYNEWKKYNSNIKPAIENNNGIVALEILDFFGYQFEFENFEDYRTYDNK